MWNCTSETGKIPCNDDEKIKEFSLKGFRTVSICNTAKEEENSPCWKETRLFDKTKGTQLVVTCSSPISLCDLAVWPEKTLK